MPAACFYHPDRPAAHTCAQCGMPICAEDTDRVGDKTVCVRCVQAVRSRVEAQMASAPPTQPGFQPQPQGYQTPQSGFQSQSQGYQMPSGGSQSFGGNAYVMPATPTTPAQWAVGIALGLVIAIAGSVAVAKFEAGASLSLSLLYVLVGYGAAWGVLKGVGRGGTPVAAAAVGCYLVGIVAGMAAEAQTLLDRVSADQPGTSGAGLGQALPFVVSHEGIIHWAFVAFGVYSCFKYVMRRS